MISPERIIQRQNALAILNQSPDLKNTYAEYLKSLSDLERLATKLKHGNINPRELGNLRNSLSAIRGLSALVVGIQHELLSFELSAELLQHITELEQALNDDLPIVSSEGGIFRIGYNQKIDEYRDLVENNEAWLRQYEQTQRSQTNIKSLKVAYNKAVGYYLEVTKANASLVPAEYHIKQNLTNANRYFTPELKEHENKVLIAESNLFNLEGELFNYLREASRSYAEEIHQLSQILARVDCLVALANLATEYDYVCPVITEGSQLEIQSGRHPVIEQLLPAGSFIDNDLYLSIQAEQEYPQIMILTGPNMSGKSTFMKQNAIIILLAQIGSYVPAKQAAIGIVDKIFTRIGASDNLALGQSTFMVEMLETANLLNNLTDRSLLLLDEIGRGTSTYDGVAIAWAITEYIADTGARTIFATHYHELNALADLYNNIQNYQVTVAESGDELIFLHKVKTGGASQSYGIEVARMAGVPSTVLKRASQIIKRMNSGEMSQKRKQLVDQCIEQMKLI